MRRNEDTVACGESRLCFKKLSFLTAEGLPGTRRHSRPEDFAKPCSNSEALIFENVKHQRLKPSAFAVQLILRSGFRSPLLFEPPRSLNLTYFNVRQYGRNERLAQRLFRSQDRNNTTNTTRSCNKQRPPTHRRELIAYLFLAASANGKCRK